MEISPDIFEHTQPAFVGKSDSELQKAKALFSIVGSNLFVQAGSSLAHLALKMHLPVSPLFRWTVYDHFCGGETFEECKATIGKLQKSGVGVLLSYGVELKETEADFDKAVQKNIEAVNFAGANKSVRAVCIKPTGFGRFALFEKIQRQNKLNKAEQNEFEHVKARFHSLCRAASKQNVELYIDAEESWIQNTLDELVEELMMQYNKEKCVVSNTFQLYRSDRLDYLQKQIQNAKKRHYFLGAKLVRGAYMEKERERAQELGYASPIHPDKPSTDTAYDVAVKLCLENLGHVYVCVASQSEQSNLSAMIEMQKMGISPDSDRVVFSQLYGMGDNVTFNQAKAGFNATKYLPYGPVKEVIPYLIRRAQENTSVAGQTGRELALIRKEIKRRKHKTGAQ